MDEHQSQILEDLYQLATERKLRRVDGSYTTYLLDKGTNKICKKIGEEIFGVVLAAKSSSKQDMINELAGLYYHLTVLMADQGVTYEDVFGEMRARRNN